jgi:hypothetical protein
MSTSLMGDGLRREVADGELAAAGLSSTAREALMHAGVFSVRALVESPWTDEEAGRRFTALKWRLSVSAYGSAKLLAHVEACRSRFLSPGSAT